MITHDSGPKHNLIIVEVEGRLFVFSNVRYTLRDGAVAARRVHTPEVGGPNPPPATTYKDCTKG